MDEIEIVMTLEEAQAWEDKVGSSANELRILLNDGYERKAWKTLGYSTWTYCIHALAEKYNFSERHIWRLQAANETEKVLTPGSVGLIPEKQLRPLAQLRPDEQRQAWTQVVETAPQGKITAAHVQSVVDEIQQKPHVSFNSGENEWYTPSDYIQAAYRVMGEIDLDPASSAIANKTVGAKEFFTADDNGLVYGWQGRVWMNPPYASNLIGEFCNKLIYHFIDDEITEAIVLVNNATETAWFGKLIQEASAILFTRGRVKFLDAQGKPGAPLQGQALIYFGIQADKFLKEFSGFGWGALICK